MTGEKEETAMMSVITSPKIKVTIQSDFDTVVKRLRQVLTADNFSILIDTSVQELVGQKTDVPMRPYWIFGAYRAELAYRAFLIAPESSLTLPHTFAVAQLADELVEVTTLDPRVVSDMIGSPYLKAAAEELYNCIHQIMEAITA
jgi:uncharacterized protein (DUF302 family)